ncbi:MAG: hypothetical protein PSV13_20490 [Lacunisphaera sp.]|nr:hypothetical protein [Lacunisphaera sp.]
MQQHRTELENLRDYKQSVGLLDRGKTSEAREILARLAGESVTPQLKIQAQALLDSVAGQ